MRIVIYLSVLFLLGCSAQQTVPVENAELKYNPKAAQINVQLGANYIASKNYLAADEKLKRALQQDPKSSKAHWVYAILQEKLAQPEAAETYYRKALKIDNKDTSGMYNYATFLCRHKRYQASAGYFQQVLADPLYPSRATAFLRAGLCAMEIPDYSASQHYFEETLKLQNNQRVALYQLAKLNFKTKKYVQAKHHIAGFESVSEHTQSSLLLAYQIEHALGDTVAAQEYADMLKHDYPDSQEVQLLVESADETQDK